MSRRQPQPPSRLEGKKAGDVAALAIRLRASIACATCRLGIAADIVGRHWNNEAVDWVDDNGGHTCELLEKGMSPAQEAAVLAIEKDYVGAAA